MDHAFLHTPAPSSCDSIHGRGDADQLCVTSPPGQVCRAWSECGRLGTVTLLLSKMQKFAKFRKPFGKIPVPQLCPVTTANQTPFFLHPCPFPATTPPEELLWDAAGDQARSSSQDVP